MASVELESAIPAHLKQERTQKIKRPKEDYQPPFPAYVSRFSESLKDVVIATVGAQHKVKPDSPSTALSQLLKFVQSKDVRESSQPIHYQLAECTDNMRYFNEVVIAYWKKKSDYEEWMTKSGFASWWKGLDANAEQHGWFKEVFYPPVDRFETVFSATVPEGVAYMHENFSGTVQEHVYWGSMRDRLPITQTDEVAGTKLQQNGYTLSDSATVPATSDIGTKDSRTRRIHVPGQKNLTVIRSGQDWSNTTPHERDLYLKTMHPVLIRGMDFLRDEGLEVGCISNRFMTVLDPKTLKSDGIEKTYGLGYFDDLTSLEKWSKQHKTHLDIFGRFLQYAKELENNVSLRLFHEVLVLEASQQDFEYVGCHDKSGMLAVL